MPLKLKIGFAAFLLVNAAFFYFVRQYIDQPDRQGMEWNTYDAIFSLVTSAGILFIIWYFGYRANTKSKSQKETVG